MSFFLEHLGNATSFLIDPWNFHMLFLQLAITLEIPCSQPAVMYAQLTLGSHNCENHTVGNYYGILKKLSWEVAALAWKLRAFYTLKENLSCNIFTLAGKYDLYLRVQKIIFFICDIFPVWTSCNSF